MPEKDIKKLEAEIKRLRKLVYYDELTGVLNRRGFLEEAGKSFAAIIPAKTEDERRRELPVPFSVVFLDIDNFKKVNDSFGHDAGDEVLRAVGKLLPAHFRARDAVGRWGGEEFVIALLGADAKVTHQVAERMRQAVANFDVPIGDKILRVTLSIGIAQHAKDQDLSTLITHADEAMYQAKKSGKNRVVVHGDETQARLLSN
ncbi:MAG: GGDEF domain-containing protein [Patescibacteria group bacterium]